MSHSITVFSEGSLICDLCLIRDDYQWSRIKTGYLHILEIYFSFLYCKVRHFANAF